MADGSNTTPRERPILFSAEMVRAVLDGRKTQTRRSVGGCSIRQPGILIGLTQPDTDRVVFDTESSEWYCDGGYWHKRCPYGRIGDRLWVRETWGVGTRPCPVHSWRDGIEYRADCIDDCAPPLYDVIPEGVDADSIRPGWRPSIHMPRWASRITLEVTEVRVQRLQDISADDACAEGVGDWQPDTTRWWSYDPVGDFRALWESIYGVDNWLANPWVWAVSFRRVEVR